MAAYRIENAGSPRWGGTACAAPTGAAADDSHFLAAAINAHALLLSAAERQQPLTWALLLAQLFAEVPLRASPLPAARACVAWLSKNYHSVSRRVRERPVAAHASSAEFLRGKRSCVLNAMQLFPDVLDRASRMPAFRLAGVSWGDVREALARL